MNLPSRWRTTLPMKKPRGSSDTAMSNAPSDFVVTKAQQRFAEFGEACRRYRYIGLCYCPPGVGKTLSAQHYANWDTISASIPPRDASTTALTTLLDSDTVFYNPQGVNKPAQVGHTPRHL